MDFLKKLYYSANKRHEWNKFSLCLNNRWLNVEGGYLSKSLSLTSFSQRKPRMTKEMQAAPATWLANQSGQDSNWELRPSKKYRAGVKTTGTKARSSATGSEWLQSCGSGGKKKKKVIWLDILWGQHSSCRWGVTVSQHKDLNYPNRLHTAWSPFSKA